MSEQHWWQWKLLRAWFLLGFGVLAAVATVIGLVNTVRAAGDRADYERESHAVVSAHVTRVVVETGTTRTPTYRLEVDNVSHVDFPSGNELLDRSTPGSPVEVEYWRDRAVAVRGENVRAETVAAPAVEFGRALGVSLIGFGCVVLGIGGWLWDRRRGHRPVVDAALAALIVEGAVALAAGWLLMVDPLRGGTGRYTLLTAVVGTCVAAGIGLLLYRRAVPRMPQHL